MSLACNIVAGCLLLFILSTQGAAPENDLFWGTLGQDINMDIPGFETNDSIEDITWEKDKKRVARFPTRNKPKNQDDKYIVSVNGTLKIKQLRMEDEGAYKVLMYNKNGKNELERTFQLKIQEKISKPKITWNCTAKMLFCEVANGTDIELKLYLNESKVRTAPSKNISHPLKNRWKKTSVKCMAKNKVSEESTVETSSCSASGHLFHYWHLWRRHHLRHLYGSTHLLHQQKEKTEPEKEWGRAGDKSVPSDHEGKGPEVLPGPGIDSSKSSRVRAPSTA
ncbi:T-cell surface antigen CD2 isoform X2 [Crocuta crocuta]